jgi:hypothetical protein
MATNLRPGTRKAGYVRKTFLSLLVLVLAAAAFVGPQTPGLLLRAYLYGLPAYEVARARDFALTHQHHSVNTLTHMRALSDYTTRLITTPNNDTLYSSGFLDVSQGPVSINVPVFGQRYYSLAFIDTYTNNFAIIGARTIGGNGAHLLVVPPGWNGTPPAGTTLVRAPTPQIWLLVRILIDGPQDLTAVHQLQDEIVLTGSAGAAPEPIAVPLPAQANGPDFVRVVNAVLAADPPPAADAPELQALQAVGIGANAAPLSLRQRLIWRAAYPLLRRGLIKATAERHGGVNGWSYSRPDIGDFGTDYSYRAAVALRGLLALPQIEAIYTVPVTDDRGQVLDGSHRYLLHLPPGAPPVHAFWSLTAYQPVADGGLYFTDNAIHRYSFGDRTAGLVRNEDGSIDILIQHVAPPAGAAANWLPVPAGPFVLVMRAYLPGADLLDGRFHYPPIQRLN